MANEIQDVEDSLSYIVIYYDVNTKNLYDSTGAMVGNNTLSAFLANTFTLELHYVEDAASGTDPTEWPHWRALEGKTVTSVLSFDNNYIHALKGATSESANAGASSISVKVAVNSDVLDTSGVLVINPFGTEDEKFAVFYSAFTYEEDTYIFTLENPLDRAVPEGAVVRVNDPLYLYIDSDTIYETNIPDRFSQGIFKFPMNIMSRKLIDALDYTGAAGVNGTIEHKIYINKKRLKGISVTGLENALVRTLNYDAVAKDTSDDNTYLFCAWSLEGEGTPSYWTRGNTIDDNGSTLYLVNDGIAIPQESIVCTPFYLTDVVVYRTFTFPFTVNNLMAYGSDYTAPIQDSDLTKDYIISIIRDSVLSSNYILNTDEFKVTSYNVSINSIPMRKVFGLDLALDAKQDNLTDALNAGDYISITDGGIINVTEMPQTMITGLTDSLASKQSNLTNEANAGDYISITNGGVINVTEMPQTMITGLTAALNSKQDNLTDDLNAGDYISITTGGVINVTEMPQTMITGLTASLNSKQNNLTDETNAGDYISIAEGGVISVTEMPQTMITGLTDSLASKQDNLTDDLNAGDYISITTGGVINVTEMPQTMITGLTASLASKQDNLTNEANAGDGITIENGVISYSGVTYEFNDEEFTVIDGSTVYINSIDVSKIDNLDTTINTALEDYVTNESFNTTLTGYVPVADVDTIINTAVTSASDYIAEGANYVTTTSLNTTLEDYVTNTTLNDTLTGYVPVTGVDDIITSAVSSATDAITGGSTLDDYVTNDALNTTLTGYVPVTDVDGIISSAVNSATEAVAAGEGFVTDTTLNTTLEDYVTNTTFDNTLTGYVTGTTFASVLSEYVTGNTFTTVLNGYIPVEEVDNIVSAAVSSALASNPLTVDDFESSEDIEEGGGTEEGGDGGEGE